jgi:hypothetical protein
MTAEQLAERVLNDEALTSHLDGPAAECVVAFLLARAESLAQQPDSAAKLDALCRAVRKAIPAESTAETVDCLLQEWPA